MLTTRLILVLAIYGLFAGLSLNPANLVALQIQTPPPQEVIVAGPLPGSALQGLVTISGSTAVEGFQSAEVAFAYQSDPTGTWFLIAHGNKPVEEGTLASWDTTTISDGHYRLRVQVYLQDGRVLDRQVEGLRVRNYLPIETPTPVISTEDAVILPTATATPLSDYRPPERTPLPAPTNPAQLTSPDLGRGVMFGTVVVVGALVTGAAYAGIKALLKR